MSPDYNGIWFSAATANEKCSYCEADLKKKASVRLEGDKKTRFLCPDCWIGVLDAVIKKPKKKK